MSYVHQRVDWPQFRFDQSELTLPLGRAHATQAQLLGKMGDLGFSLRSEATVRSLTAEILQSNAIEGEHLDPAAVRSSLARKLGVDLGVLTVADHNVDGIVEMMLDATQRFDRPFTKNRLFRWHRSLFPTGQSGMKKIRVGAWRNDRDAPMRVVSGPIGRERVHFEAPIAERVDAEMSAFFAWFEDGASIDPLLKAAIAHLWFVTIHPFDDGNGRIARAVSELLLARSEQSAQRFYGMSTQIIRDRAEYYAVLEATQRGNLDITRWLVWFLATLERAMVRADDDLAAVLRKARFWQRARAFDLNDRQRLILNRLFDGFDGKLTSSKWAKIAKCSPDTALRDIERLIELGVLRREPAGGRSTAYALIAG